MSCYRIAEIGGDGIGPEVVAEAVRVLQALEATDLHFSFERAAVGAALYRRTGEDLPRETIDLCRSVDAILFGAAGLPDVRHADGTELVPQVTLRMLLDLSNAAKTNTRWKSDEYDRVWHAAEREMDPVKRAALFIRMNDTVVREGVVIPIIWRNEATAVAYRLRGVEITPWGSDLWNLAYWHRQS
jgi:isocitrate/isopropylmalate dehydrogenase